MNSCYYIRHRRRVAVRRPGKRSGPQPADFACQAARLRVADHTGRIRVARSLQTDDTKHIQGAHVTTDTTTLITNLRTVLELTSTEIQIAEFRTSQARTDAVLQELTKNAENARTRAALIEATIRELGGSPTFFGPSWAALPLS